MKISIIYLNNKYENDLFLNCRGAITTLKLSPNLRIKPKAPKKQAHITPLTLELMKLSKLLALVREPNNLTHPPDTEVVVQT